MNTRTIYRDLALSPDTEEYLTVSVAADVELDGQVVEFTFDRETYYAAEWVGDVGTTRSARLLMDDSNLPTGSTPIYVRVNDSPEKPIIPSGNLTVR